MSITKIKRYEKEEVLIFITNMKKTGQNVLKALIHFTNNMAKREEVKQAVNEIVVKINKGKNIEEALYDSKFINDFQYSILINSKNKNEAYDKILNYNKNKNVTDRFYIKNWSKSLLSLIAMCYAMPYLNGVVGNMVSNVKGYKDSFQVNGLVQFFLDYNDFFVPIGTFLLLIFVFGLFYYFYTYKQNLVWHYKIFRLKAISDSLMYFEIINDMLKSGLKTYVIFDLLSKYMYPASSREIFEQIYLKLKNNKNYIDDFENLGVNNFTVFTLKTAQEIGDIKGGFKNALISIRDYKEKKEKFYYEVVDLFTFLIIVLPFSLILWYLTVVTIDISSI